MIAKTRISILAMAKEILRQQLEVMTLMVVKSATKKKLMDMLVPEEFAHKLADDRKWDDVKVLTAQEIAQFCETDSDTAARIHGIITGASASKQ